MKTYADVLNEIGKKRAHIILGNGFSIACSRVFSYGSLFDKAETKGLSENAKKVFWNIGTNNFEGVMHLLEKSDWVGKLYGLISSDSTVINSDIDLIRNVLVESIVESHLSMPSEIDIARYKKAIAFLSPYHNIFTTNYDLLPYWIDMNDDVVEKYQDGFRSDIDDPEAEYVIFSEHTKDAKGLFFLHGALHLYQVSGEVRKHCWERSGTRLVEKIKVGLAKREYPLFIAEGKSEQKMEQINQSSYLSYCFSKLRRVQNFIVVYGSSLGDNDLHIVNAISENRDIGKVFIGVYDEKNVQQTVQIDKMKDYAIARRLLVDSKRPLQVEYYDSKTIEVW